MPRRGLDPLGVRLVRRSEDRHEELGLPDLAGQRVGDRDGLAREVEEQLLAGAMILAQDDVEPPGPGAVVLGEPGVPEAIGAARAVFSPCQGERDALAPELAVDEGPVRDRALLGRWRRLSPIQALLEGSVVEIR